MNLVSLSQERLRLLSPNARDLLERILDAFPHDDLFGSGVPAAPAQLRLTLYHSDDPRLDSQIGRQLKELELNSIGILRRVSRKTRYLKLTLDFSGALGHNATASGTEALQKPDVVGRFYETPNRLPVIHNSGLAPPIDHKKIAVVASTAVSSSDLIEKLKPYFPAHDVSAEFRRYFAHREKMGRPVVTSAFVKWMLRAEVPLQKPERKRPTLNAQRPTPNSEQMDLFDEASARRFAAELEARKMRKQKS